MNTNIKNIRLTSQQLSKQLYNNPKELISWMGAMQAQDFNMAKWAIAIRLESCTEQSIEEAFNRGDFIRTHVMRPTWHFVIKEDLRWLLQLTGSRIKAACNSFAKDLKIEEKEYTKYYLFLDTILRDNIHKTKEEITEALTKAGILSTPKHINSYLMHAEADSIICSGSLKGKKQTYALLDERISKSKDIHKEEALALLAQKFIKSHSPARLQDFVWWSGLTIKEARYAFELIGNELIKEHFDSTELYIHESYKEIPILSNDILHFLPSYDEYLISYKNRTDVLDIEHHPKAFNNYGIFQPVILFNGQAVGHWKAIKRSTKIDYNTSFWIENTGINEELILQAKKRMNIYFNME